MKLVLHGQLRDRFGDSFDFVSETVADAVEGLSRQLPDWPRDMLIDVVGFDTVEKLTTPTDANEVHLIPAMYGGGGKFGSIIMGAALIGLSLVAPELGIPLSQSVGSALLVSGGIMAAQGVFSLFLKAPTISKANDPAPSKYLGLNQNTTEAGTPITLAWGRIKLNPHWLSMQSDSDNLAYGVWPVSPA